jgi:hypothetical protein
MKFTQEELEKFMNDLEEGLMERAGINTVSSSKIDTTGWTKEDFEKEIERLRGLILTNMNAFAIPKIKVNNEKE